MVKKLANISQLTSTVFICKLICYEQCKHCSGNLVLSGQFEPQIEILIILITRAVNLMHKRTLKNALKMSKKMQ
jgi:hypothetical protein